MPKVIDKQLHKLEHAEVVYVDTDTIKPNTYNPNRQSDRDFELLCRSIEEDGFTQPIIVQKETMEIVDGEHRWRALQMLGHIQVPIVFVEFTQAQMMVSTLRHNRARGNENINMAADVLRDLQNLGKLDMAADSLMLDDVELKIMLQDIPASELILRTPGDKLTVAQVQEQIGVERGLVEQKEEQDREQGGEDRRTLSYILTYLYGEKIELEKVCSKKHVAGIIALAAKYAENKEVLEMLDRDYPC